MAVGSVSWERERSVEQVRAILGARLRVRGPELEETTLNRISSLSGAPEAVDAQYLESQRAAVSAALDYGFAAIEVGDERTPAVPAALLYQARLAARNGVSLDTVLRRYLAGYSLLGHFLIQEAQRESLLQGAELQRVMQALAVLFDRLITTVTQEHALESENRLHSPDGRAADRVRKLLAGELVDTSQFRYEFEAWHMGMLLAGPGGADCVRQLAKALDRQLLIVSGGEASTWAWLGGKLRIHPTALQRISEMHLPAGLSLAVGEPAHGLSGWRTTYQQARAALPIARRGPDAVVRYSDVALLSSIVQDDLLMTSLREIYLKPLSEGRAGETLLETLRAYFATERNLSSTASAIGVNRRTVANRLRAAEARLGRSLHDSAPSIEAALRLHELGPPAVGD